MFLTHLEKRKKKKKKKDRDRVLEESRMISNDSDVSASTYTLPSSSG